MSLVRRVAVVALVVALVAAGTALAGRYDPRRKLTPADQARAAAMLLRTTDLGRGYSPLPGPSTWTPQKCAALDESVLTLTGERFAPSWTARNALVVAVARVYASVADADRSWRLELGPVGVKCQSAPSGGAPVTISPMTIPALAPRTIALRMHFTAAIGGGVRSSRRRDCAPARTWSHHLRDRHADEVASVARARAPARSHPRRPSGDGDARRVTARSGAAGAAAPAPNRVGCPSGRPSGRVQNGP